jgi:hypothetical protein
LTIAADRKFSDQAAIELRCDLFERPLDTEDQLSLF